MFTNGIDEFKADNRSLRKTIVKHIVAKILESKLLASIKQAGLETPNDFNHEDIMNEIKSYFLN